MVDFESSVVFQFSDLLEVSDNMGTFDCPPWVRDPGGKKLLKIQQKEEKKDGWGEL